MRALLTYHNLRIFFDERKILNTEDLQELADKTDNIYQVIAVGAALNKKMHKKVQNYCAFEESSKGLYNIIRGYTEITAVAEPIYNNNTFRTYLYMTAESAILDEKLTLLKGLSKIMKFEHPHLRIGFFVGNEKINKVLIQHYNKTYIIAELT